MKAEELRIGNYLEHNKHGLINVLGVKPHCDNHMIIHDDTWCYLTNCKPIPLTEQWLIDFGWGKGEYDTEYQDNVSMDQYILSYNVNAQMFTIESHNDVVELAHIKYVHQLQNLYFALTGQELQL